MEQAPPPAPPAPRPVRRVGTTTMGLVLVVAGIAITAGMLNPDLDFSLLCKLSPLVLVALGGEVLIVVTLLPIFFRRWRALCATLRRP